MGYRACNNSGINREKGFFFIEVVSRSLEVGGSRGCWDVVDFVESFLRFLFSMP